MKIIVNHPHYLDIFSVALVIYKRWLDKSIPVTIESREATSEDMEDPDTWCIGCGWDNNPDLHNFKDTQNTHRLVAQCLDLDYCLELVYPWWSLNRFELNSEVFSRISPYDKLLIDETVPTVLPILFDASTEFAFKLTERLGRAIMFLVTSAYNTASKWSADGALKRLDKITILHNQVQTNATILAMASRLLSTIEGEDYPDVITEREGDSYVVTFVSVEKFNLHNLLRDPYSLMPMKLDHVTQVDVERFILDKLKIVGRAGLSQTPPLDQ